MYFFVNKLIPFSLSWELSRNNDFQETQAINNIQLFCCCLSELIISYDSYVGFHILMILSDVPQANIFGAAPLLIPAIAFT